jgi:glycosyltransferase involved in cell wall biosynthesis
MPRGAGILKGREGARGEQMRVLIAHNRYQQSGGEDIVVAAESDMLSAHGHTVDRLEVDNDHIQGTLSRITASVESIYSPESRQLMKRAIENARPDVVHIHNFFPAFSPSVFYACADANVPVVHTLHNYRILCASATLFRDGHLCEECVSTRSFLPGIRHACYRSSRIGSAVAGFGMALHSQIGTWANKVSAFIALSPFAAGKLGSFRIPREKIVVKPNSAVDRGVGSGDGSYAVFAGRLSAEKGVQTLIDADAAGALCMDVVILGDGSMRSEVQRVAERPGSRLICKGFVSHDQILDYMRSARVLIMPSLCYEGGLPLAIIEAFSFGLPVIGADLGNTGALVQPGETGLLYRAGDHHALSSMLAWYADNPAAAQHMRKGARAYYLAEHTPEKNYQRLIEIYQSAINCAVRPELQPV